MARVSARRKAHPLGLSSIDMNVVDALEKHGELMLDFSGKYFGNVLGRAMVDRKRVEKLAGLGICRVDVVGASTFAVFLRMPDGHN